MPRPPQPSRSPKSDGGHVGTLSTHGVDRPSVWARLVWFARRAGAGIGAVFRTPIWCKLWRVFWKTAAALAVLTVIGMLAVCFILWPRASVVCEWMQYEASSALHATMDIGSFETYWEGRHPAFRAQCIDAYDTVGRRTFAIQDVQARPSWRSLLRMQVIFVVLHATRADLLIRYDTQGALSVAGMQLNVDIGGDSIFLDQLLPRGDIDFQQGAVRWLDEQQKLPEVALGNARLQLCSGPTRHRLGVSGTSPTPFNGSIKLHADFRHDLLAHPGDQRHWHGQASRQVDTLRLAFVQRYMPVLAIVQSDMLTTDGSVEFADGVLTRSQARLTGQQLDLQVRKNLESLQLRSLQTLATHQCNARDEHILRVDTLLQQPLNLPAQSLSVPELADSGIQVSTNPAGTPRGVRNVTVGRALDACDAPRSLQVKVATLDLADPCNIATALPLSAGVLGPLWTKQSSGRTDDLDIDWQRDVSCRRPNTPAPVYFTGRAMMRQASFGPGTLSAVPSGQHPELAVLGVENLFGNAVFLGDKGTPRVESNDTTLLLSGIFADVCVPLDWLRGTFNWTYRKQELVVVSDNLAFSNDDLSMRITDSYRHTPGISHLGIIDLEGTLDRADVLRVPRYLPLPTGQHLRDYSGGALQAGMANNIGFALAGDLHDFPFRPPHKGVFRVEVSIQDVTYQSTPAEIVYNLSGQALTHPDSWPAFTNTDGTATFDRASFTFKVVRAKVMGVDLQDVNGSLPDMGDHNSLLAIEGRDDGVTQNSLQYIEAGPISQWIGHFTKDARTQGLSLIHI